MQAEYPILHQILLGIELLSALVGLWYFFKLKNSYWKWFCVYLVFIFAQEYFWKYNNSFLNISIRDYFAFIGIPIEFIFFYWLYAVKSLNNKKLFILCSLIFLIAIPLDKYVDEKDLLYSVSINIQTIILTVLVVMEFRKQIKNDDILKFKENKMFYINTAMILFYVGNYPFYAIYTVLYEQYKEIYNIFYLYFLISNCLMYLLFIASLIWGKQKS